MFDMRTITILIWIYNLFFGILIFILSKKTNRIKGLDYFGIAFFSLGLSFMLIGFRDLIPDFFTIIIAHQLICFGNIYLYLGAKKFKKIECKWRITDTIIQFSYFLIFLFYTYNNNNVNVRVIVYSFYEIFHMTRIILVLNLKTHVLIKKSLRYLSTIFVMTIILSILRIIDSIYGIQLQSLMDSGTIHTSFALVVQLTPFVVIVGLLWVSNIINESELEEIALIDQLTGIYNRNAIIKLASSEFERNARTLVPVSVVMFDIDHFKKVNDTYGHLAGDVVIKRIAQIIKINIRDYDFFGRYGGEEFMMIMQEIKTDELKNKLNKLRMIIESMDFIYDSNIIKITISFGAYTTEKQPYDFQEAIKQADIALYKAKNNGRNQVIII